MAKVLVVYFSRTGETRLAATHVAEALGADLDEITEARDRRGVLGYVRSGFEAFFGLRPKIRPTPHTVGDYDLVIVATPIWNVSLASPMRSWLATNAPRIARLGVLLSCERMGVERVLRQIEDVTRRKALVQMALTDDDRARGRDFVKMDRFVAAARRLLEQPRSARAKLVAVV